MKVENGPAWYYGPASAAMVFQSGEVIPDGWVDHPSKVGVDQPEAPGASLDVKVVNGEVVDKSGLPWDATVNTANRQLTGAGLWQLLPGKTRPAAPVASNLDL